MSIIWLPIYFSIRIHKSMRTKSAEHVKIINTRVPEKLDKIVTKYCIDNNKSKSEFVREAVERYVSYLELWEALIEIGEKDYEN